MVVSTGLQKTLVLRFGLYETLALQAGTLVFEPKHWSSSRNTGPTNRNQNIGPYRAGLDQIAQKYISLINIITSLSSTGSDGSSGQHSYKRITTTLHRVGINFKFGQHLRRRVTTAINPAGRQEEHHLQNQRQG
ncbi:hypothetical protein Zmor_013465 [Zophobas morio]|uniref:Uncharacterized protein n=1 Tax=Zophobas morio TaxID=2755281 RepID=A0AA38IHM6_9CUCU|nr:hypothetical protein Zmor_013465 [Zophobas morio]